MLGYQAVAAAPRRARGRHRARTVPLGGRRNRQAGGVYGTILASALLIVMDTRLDPHPVDDALWIVMTALAAAAMHAHVHSVGTPGRPPRRVLYDLVTGLAGEWPLLASVLPTAALLLLAAGTPLTAYTAVYAALVVNAAMLLGWGVLTGRRGGRSWPAAFLAGTGEVAIGVGIIAVTAAVK
ncbi:hypothetical protein G3I60_29715 [Streptomyces sp. SID13666]|uniref:hypothetical protein n=1 Tax=Streptomyces TaxID=1883 RepID=UPI0011071EDA|nr:MULTISPECIES: hypothetical protein [Streptomyces]NEA58224.1 hypothetical protein [Streptomyces sp. SID13666]NEA73923.1 hypothetical protein [Streptomyces sp. SID13588]QNA76130.1 hypothetical protein C8250_033385 [Streptomyces sp. So13.3]